MSTKPVGIGIVGAGVISEIYMKNLGSMFPGTYLVGVSDILPERAERAELGMQALQNGTRAITRKSRWRRTARVVSRRHSSLGCRTPLDYFAHLERTL